MNLDKKKNLVSVIIPYYKKKNFIKITLKSVLAQTYKNFEIIIIYDDQDLSDYKYLIRLFKSNNNIKIYLNPKKLGAGFSRNKGIDLAKGEFIAFIDADDIWKKNKLEKQIKFMKKNNYNISHTSYEIINEKNIVLSQRKSRNFYYVKDLIKSCDVGLSTVIIKRKILDIQTRFPNLKTKEDFVLWLKILKKNEVIGACDEILTSWRKLHNSLSSSSLQKLLDAFKVYKVYMKFNILKSLYYTLCLSFNFLKKLYD